MKTGLVFYASTAISYKFFCELLYLVSFLFQLGDSFTLYLYHLFEVVALKYKVRNGLFIVGFVDPANFDEHVESFMLK